MQKYIIIIIIIIIINKLTHYLVLPAWLLSQSTVS